MEFVFVLALGIKAKVYAFEDFQRNPMAATSDPLPNKKPWLPFKSRLEFEVAQIALEAVLNNDQTDRLIKICRQCAIGNDKFTFENHKDIHRKWDAASQHVTGFTKEVISMTYEDKSWDFEVHYRDLWEWAADLLRDPRLFPHLTFDAQHLSKFDADAFWDLQSQLPEGAKPLIFKLYADKTKLSTSGTAKAYPVVTRLANLPTDICNGEGIGGGYVVGWLPVVKEDKEFVKKPGWAFSRILASLTSKSKMGQWFECLDRLSRWFFPSILILSADYEEHKDLQAIVNLARTKHTLEEREKTLKEYGLCDVDNSLWLIQRIDVHRALSYDKLHFRDGGLFDDHLWVEFQKYLNDLGRDVVSHIDKRFGIDASYRFKEFPRWRNQKHPNQVMDIAFTDSSIPENISKMILYAAHDVVTEEDCPLGYLLLQCIRLYIKVDMYASLEVHTLDTICEGRNIVQMFSGFLKQYIEKTADIEDKGWNFLKLHMNVHLFDDIEVKGATRNYNTKPNEKMHGSLKDSYLLRTNFQNVAEQILRINHWQLAAEDIHRRLLDFDEYLHLQTQDQFDAADDALNATDDAVIPLAGFFHVKVGSKQPPLTFDDDAFSNLHIRLNDFLNDFLPAINIPLLQGKQIRLRASDKITEFRFLKVNYESMVDWRQHTDYLRCSPQFFGAPRFDCIFIHMTPTKVIFGRLLFLFECTVGKHTFPLALVHPYDAPTGICLRKDKNFNLFRVRARTRAQSQFFSVRSIIRGALLVPDGPSDYLVVDTVDTYMFVHMREMHLEAGHLCFFIKSHLIAPPSHSNISLPSTSSSNYTLQHSPSVHPSINQALVNIDVSTAVM
ncbi:hypothetical protein BDR07DRAFT_1453323 [Suillus spraguei]|nr:hypothetical protein BDR07DRAFT_1453323 [Suillus spraguei]